ncbi:MAG: DUF86 domain-containing protein [Chloroflexi bacterium]|nr:DUF86 domain-containing protein [Chloroflexota bacterium]
MRNIIVHGYFNLDLDIVWRTIRNDVLPLAPLLRNIIATF